MDYQREPLSGGDAPERENGDGWVGAGQEAGESWSEPARESQSGQDWKASPEPAGGLGPEASTEPNAALGQPQEAVSFGNNGMALASLVMGIMSLVCCCCSWLGTPCGALGIIFALLSKGDEPMSSQAKTGLILSIIGIALGVILLILFAGAQAFMAVWEVID